MSFPGLRYSYTGLVFDCAQTTAFFDLKFQINVLVSKLNPQFPRVWFPDVNLKDRAVCSTEFMQFTPVAPGGRAFLYDLLRSEPIQAGIRSRVTGTTGSRQRAKPREVAAMAIAVPPTEEITRYSEIVGPLHLRRLSNRQASRTLAGLRDCLLPRLISGEIRVPETVTEVERVAG